MKKIVSILVCLALLGSAGAYAAAPASVKIDQTAQAGGTLSVFFHAADAAGADMTGLTPENVELALDGRVLPAQVESAAAAGVGYVFAVDVSVSLSPEQFAAVREQLKGWIGAMGPQDMAAIVAFGTQVTTVSELSGDVNALLTALGGLTPADPEAMLYSGITQAADVAARQGEGLPLRRAVVLVSDGRASAADPVGMDAARASAAGSGVPLYAAQAAAEDNVESLAALSDMALATGGRAETEGKDTLSAALERLRAYIGGGLRAWTDVPGDMADGATRTLALTVTAEAMSAGDSRTLTVAPPAAAAQEPAEAQDGAQPPAPEEAPPEEDTPEEDASEEEPAEDAESSGDGGMKQIAVYIGIGCGGALLMLAAVLLVNRAKKRRALKEAREKAEIDQGYGGSFGGRQPFVPQPAPAPDRGPGPDVDTVPLGPDVPRGGTMPLDRPAASRLVLTDERMRRAYSAELAERITVGREADASQIVIQDAYVSARQCEVFRDGDGRVRVRDLRSKNGTALWVDGVRCAVDAETGHELCVGDVLEIGTTKLTVTSV